MKSFIQQLLQGLVVALFVCATMHLQASETTFTVSLKLKPGFLSEEVQQHLIGGSAILDIPEGRVRGALKDIKNTIALFDITMTPVSRTTTAELIAELFRQEAIQAFNNDLSADLRSLQAAFDIDKIGQNWYFSIKMPENITKTIGERLAERLRCKSIIYYNNDFFNIAIIQSNNNNPPTTGQKYFIDPLKDWMGKATYGFDELIVSYDHKSKSTSVAHWYPEQKPISPKTPRKTSGGRGSLPQLP